jgi:hypothetical protein
MVQVTSPNRKGKPFERMGRKTKDLKDFGFRIADFGIKDLNPQSEIYIPQSQGSWVAEVEAVSCLDSLYVPIPAIAFSLSIAF